LFLIVVFTTLTFHKKSVAIHYKGDGIFSNGVITNFVLILTTTFLYG